MSESFLIIKYACRSPMYFGRGLGVGGPILQADPAPKYMGLRHTDILVKKLIEEGPRKQTSIFKWRKLRKIGRYYEGTACWFIKFSDGNAIITGP